MFIRQLPLRKAGESRPRGTETRALAAGVSQERAWAGRALPAPGLGSLWLKKSTVWWRTDGQTRGFIRVPALTRWP